MIRYSIISTPRSGSTYLCSLLQKTGRMGNPEEYFNVDLIPFYQEKLKIEGNPQSYLDKIIWQSRMANDCVGVNLNSEEAFNVAKKHGWIDINTHWIRLKREDKILYCATYCLRLIWWPLLASLLVKKYKIQHSVCQIKPGCG